jgi:F0F1-type ATP synthase assembly protein I
VIPAHLVHLGCREVNGMRKTYLSDAGEANKALQDSLDRDESSIVASYALIGAILLLGGVGYAVDWWRGTSPWFLLLGLTVGILLGFYNLVASLRRR